MSNSIARNTYNSLLPDGALWSPKIAEDFDLFLDGISDNAEVVADFLECLSVIRDPNNIILLSDIEKEYGIKTNLNVSDDVRIARLSRKIYQKEKINSADDLQDALTASDFELFVHLNDPPVDPAIFLDKAFQMVAGGGNAYAGHIPIAGGASDAFAGNLGGDLLVNGDIFLRSSATEMQAGGNAGYAGRLDAVAGFYSGLNQDLLDYEIPPSGYWNMIFFIGGVATRDPVTGELTSIESGLVSNERKKELDELILRIKPLMAWCGLIVTYN